MTRQASNENQLTTESINNNSSTDAIKEQSCNSQGNAQHTVISMREVANHCENSSCWIVIEDNIYDVTEFLVQHPGGADIIMENAGRDCTVPFQDKGHTDQAKALLESFCIGVLHQDERINK